MNKYFLFLILIAGCRGKTEINTALCYHGERFSGWSVIRPGDTVFIGKDTLLVGVMEQTPASDFKSPSRSIGIPIRPDIVYVHDTIYLRSKSTNINHINQLNQY